MTLSNLNYFSKASSPNIITLGGRSSTWILVGHSHSVYNKDHKRENYRTLVKVINVELNKWRDILCSWIGRFSIVKMRVCPNLIYRFNTIKISASYFVVIITPILKFIWKSQRPRIVKTKSEDWHYSTSRLTLELQGSVIFTK